MAALLNFKGASQPFVDRLSGINHHFSDNGLFGVNVEGAGSHSSQLLGVGLEALNSLKGGVSDEDLSLAKASLKMQVLQTLEDRENRLEEMAKHYQLIGDLSFTKYVDYIDNVSSSQISDVASRVLQGKPTMVVTGDAINLVPNITDVARQLQ